MDHAKRQASQQELIINYKTIAEVVILFVIFDEFLIDFPV